MTPTLLFLPGTLCDARVWAAPQGALSDDWRGVHVDYRLEKSIADMASVALATTTGPIIPVGFSMGAIVALEMWKQAAQRVAALALFAFDPGADTVARQQNRERHVREATRGNLRAVLREEFLPTYFYDANSHARDTVMAMALDQGANAFAAQAEALANRENNWPTLGTITVPTLIAYGVDDRICTPAIHQKMATSISQATLCAIRSAGHMLTLEQPVAVTNALQGFLSAHPMKIQNRLET